MSMRDDALVREDKTVGTIDTVETVDIVGSVCEEAGSCEASASSAQFVPQSARVALWRQRLKEIFFLPFPVMVFILFMFSVYLTVIVMKLIHGSTLICSLVIFSSFMIAHTFLCSHENHLLKKLASLSSEERKTVRSLKRCSSISHLISVLFIFLFLGFFVALHLKEMRARIPAVSTSADYILLGCFVGFVFYDLILARFFKERAVWRKEASSCH